MHEKTQTLSKYDDSNTVKVSAHINKDYEVPCENINSYQDDNVSSLQQFCMLLLIYVSSCVLRDFLLLISSPSRLTWIDYTRLMPQQ